MKTGKVVYVVMVNDAVDSVWTEETKAIKRGDKLHNPSPEHLHPMFARIYNLPLNKKGKW